MFFFTILNAILDSFFNVISFPIKCINLSYILYMDIQTDALTYLINYSLSNTSKNSILSYLMFFLDLYINFDLYLFEPLLYFFSYCYIFSFFEFISNSILHVFYYSFGYIVSSSIIISLKFIVLIALLVFVRGGIPRYRFDYLTKLGWTKFLSLILLSFLLELYLIWIF